jgi:ArsR family transcriptional regulator
MPKEAYKNDNDEENIYNHSHKITRRSPEASPSDEDLETIATFFYVMSDKTRLQIISLLEKGELCVGCIADTLNMTQSAVSHQLALMKRMKLVRAKKDGRNIIYTLADEHINIVFDIAYKHILEQ